MKSLVFIILLSLCASALAQEEGVIKIRKKDSEEKWLEQASIGIRTGPSLMSISGKNVQESRYYLGDKARTLDFTYQQYKISSSGGSSSPSAEDILDVPPTSIQVTAYLIMPIHRRFSVVPEIAFRNMLAYSQAPTINAIDSVEYKFYSTDMRTEFRFAQIEVPIKLEAHFNWRIFDPYVKVGIGPVFNIYAKRIVKEVEPFPLEGATPTTTPYVEPDELPEEVKNAVEQQGFEMHKARTSIKRANVSGIWSMNMGFRFYLSKRTGLCLDAQYTDAFGINAIATYKDGKSYRSTISTMSFSLALEYKLKK